MSLRIPDGEGKHATQFFQAAFTPAAIRFQQDFGIGIAFEADPFCFQFSANFAKVINLAVVDNPIARSGILHRLMAKHGKIKNRQTTIAQANFQRLWQAFTDNDGA